MADTVHDVSSAASRRLLELAKTQVAARAGLADGLAGGDIEDDEEATMAEVGARGNGVENRYRGLLHVSGHGRDGDLWKIVRCYQ